MNPRVSIVPHDPSTFPTRDLGMWKTSGEAAFQDRQGSSWDTFARGAAWNSGALGSGNRKGSCRPTPNAGSASLSPPVGQRHRVPPPGRPYPFPEASFPLALIGPSLLGAASCAQVLGNREGEEMGEPRRRFLPRNRTLEGEGRCFPLPAL